MASGSSDSAVFLAPPSPREPRQPTLRGSSPRLFRDFFDTTSMPETASRRQATLPRPVPSHQDPLHNVNRALENANRALQDAQEAFHQARRLRTETEARRLSTNSEAPSQLVDLTTAGSPPLLAPNRPGAAESHYISHTIHPHDSPRPHRRTRLNALTEPVYPTDGVDIDDLGRLDAVYAADPSRPQNSPYTLPRANVRFWPSSRPGNVRLPRIYPLDNGQLPSAVEEEAINRQRENHSNWERTQARTRERQRHDQEQGGQSGPNSSSSVPVTAMSPPSSSSSSRNRHSHRRAPSPQLRSDPSIDEVDLTAVDDPTSLSAALSQQREEAILAQNPGTEAGRTPLTAYKCPVCMDTPTDATSTACGHVFCHRCIVDTLNWSMEQRREDAPTHRKVKGVCPVCRKNLDLKDTPGNGRSLIPLELKFMVKKRKRESAVNNGKGKAKSLVKAETLGDKEDDESVRRSSGRAKKRERESTEDEIWRAFTNDTA